MLKLGLHLIKTTQIFEKFSGWELLLDPTTKTRLADEHGYEWTELSDVLLIEYIQMHSMKVSWHE